MSFMLYQIRKMMGLIIGVMRGHADESVIDAALQKENFVNIPEAPGIGLMLVNPEFTIYNQRVGKNFQPLTWEKEEEEIEKFKKEVIFKDIVEEDEKKLVNAGWLFELDYKAAKKYFKPTKFDVTKGKFDQFK